MGESSEVPAEEGAVVIADGRQQRETPERLGRLKKFRRHQAVHGELPSKQQTIRKRNGPGFCAIF